MGEGRTEGEDLTGFSDEESAPPSSVASSSSASPRAASKTISAVTVHQNPGWLEEMKKNIQEQIISVCSARTREAVEQNEYIEIKKIFGGAGSPARKDMRELVMTLAFEYPEMFRERKEGSDGKREVDKVDVQARKMCDRYREKLRREGRKLEVAEDEQTVKNKGKQKKNYGVIAEKWNVTKKTKPEAAAMISSTSGEPNFEKREEIFTNLRDELTIGIRNCKKISDVAPGIFMDSRHLGLQFQYITNSPPLNKNIVENLRSNIDNLELYLKDVTMTVEFKSELEKVEMVCELEFGGSTVLKDITILREACNHFDKADGSKLIRLSLPSSMPSDPVVENASPHLVACLVDKTFIFELWADGSRLLGNMDMADSLAAFFHLCFCFDLKYPKEGETVADLLQRGVAKYGDNSGTRTWKRRDSAQKKIDSYYSKLGRLV